MQAPTLSGSSDLPHSEPKPGLRKASRSVPLGSSAMPVRGHPRSGEWKPIGTSLARQAEMQPVFRVLLPEIPWTAVAKNKNRFAKIRNHFHLHGGAPSPTLPPTLTGETPQRPKRGETLGRDLRIAFGRVGEGPTDRPSGRATASELRQWCGTGSRVLGNGDPAAERLRPATSVATRLGARALPEDRVGMRSPERVGASAPAFSGPSRCWTTRRSCGRHDTRRRLPGGQARSASTGW